MFSMSSENAQTNQPFCRSGVSIGMYLTCGSSPSASIRMWALRRRARHVPGVHPLQFRQADGRLHLGHAVVPADAVVDVGQLLLQGQQVQPLLDVVAVVAEAAGLPGQVLVVGGDHAAFAAGGEGLVLAEAARRHVAERAGLLALVRAAEGLGVVLDHERLCFLAKAMILSMSQTLP